MTCQLNLEQATHCKLYQVILPATMYRVVPAVAQS